MVQCPCFSKNQPAQQSGGDEAKQNTFRRPEARITACRHESISFLASISKIEQNDVMVTLHYHMSRPQPFLPLTGFPINMSVGQSTTISILALHASGKFCIRCRQFRPGLLRGAGACRHSNHCFSRHICRDASISIRSSSSPHSVCDNPSITNLPAKGLGDRYAGTMLHAKSA
jgi:hypothetical protein